MAHHLEEPAPGQVVLGLAGEVVLQVVDARGQKRDLGRGAAAVAAAGGPELPDDIMFLFFRPIIFWLCPLL